MIKYSDVKYETIQVWNLRHNSNFIFNGNPLSFAGCEVKAQQRENE